ncbi:MAG TPA: histidine--tRNA ligase [Vicinamibacterales bacterium]|nr:histidine--tRNA ligase [Vicinamibacterales bacterium]
MASHTHPARGMRDFLPDDVRRRRFVIDAIRDVYERYGFDPLETPALENVETLTGKYGEEGNQLIFKVLRRGEHAASGETDLALRYDLTVPLARVVADHRGTLPRVFKRYQIQPVWRADRPARGRFREFYQCDVDVIGSRSMLVEAELCGAATDVLAALGFSGFRLRLNHRAVLNGILETAGVPAAQHGDALVALDKLDKIGREGVGRELADRGIETAAAERFLQLMAVPGGSAARLDEIAAALTGHPAGSTGLLELREVLALSRATAAGPHLEFDPSLARGLSYYTGVIMEVAVADLAGSLGGGGRYDGLIGMFAGEQIPAAGFSLGLERILVVMTERQMFPPHVTTSAPDVVVTRFDEASGEDSLRLAGELRAEGLRVDVYPDPDKLSKQFKYAAARGAGRVAILGPDERARGEVMIKNMESGEQHAVSRRELNLLKPNAQRPTPKPDAD